MRSIVAAALLTALAGCAAEAPAAHGIHDATSGEHRLRFLGAAWSWGGRHGDDRELSLRFDLGQAGQGTLLSRRRDGPLWLVLPSGTRAGTDHAPLRAPGGGTTVVVERLFMPAHADSLAELTLEFIVLRVDRWREHERAGLMDASLDEMEWPPFRLGFAGEGESAWLSASLARDYEGPLPAAEALAEHLPEEFVTDRATIRDAKGRDLVRYATDHDHERRAANASYAVGKPGGPVEADPAIQYPVTLRLRIPELWTAERVQFRFRDLPLPPPPPPPAGPR
jgi:hypothetical protein